MAYTESVSKVGDRVIDGMKKVDQAIVSGASIVAQRLGDVLPNELPGASYLRNLPKPEELTKTYWEFIERLVKTQRTYSLDLVKAFEPITGKIWKQPVRKAA